MSGGDGGEGAAGEGAPRVLSAEIVAEGLVWPEGPAVLEDGSVAFVETYRSQVSVWTPGHGVRRLAHTGGGPNAVCLGADGCLYVTQNGGVVGDWRADDLLPGSIQRVSPDGKVETVATEVDGLALRMPNDLAFGPDGRLYFTDPGLWDIANRPDAGRLFALAPDGSGELLAETEPTFPNGVAVETDGSPVWVESYTRRIRRLLAGGAIQEIATLAEATAIPDGLAIAADGSLVVTTLVAGGLRVVGPDGSARGSIDVGLLDSNCTFDGTVLYVTDGGGDTGLRGGLAPAGLLWRVELDVAGLPLWQGSIA